MTPAVDLLPVALTVLDDMKAEAVVDIDLAGKTSIADAMIIASGRSQRHVGAIADASSAPSRRRGMGRSASRACRLCDWVLIDAGDLVVHIFRPEIRAFYNLEKMWGAGSPLRGRGTRSRLSAASSARR